MRPNLTNASHSGQVPLLWNCGESELDLPPAGLFEEELLHEQVSDHTVSLTVITHTINAYKVICQETFYKGTDIKRRLTEMLKRSLGFAKNTNVYRTKILERDTEIVCREKSRY